MLDVTHTLKECDLIALTMAVWLSSTFAALLTNVCTYCQPLPPEMPTAESCQRLSDHGNNNASNRVDISI